MEVELRPGTAGDELWARSPYLALGVIGDGMLRRTADGYATVGDLAERTADGGLRILGRGDAAITIAGATVLAEHVEAQLAALPGVDAAAVLGEPHVLLGQRILAVVELADGVELDRVVTAARAALSPVELPVAGSRDRCRAPTRERSPAECCATPSPPAAWATATRPPSNGAARERRARARRHPPRARSAPLGVRSRGHTVDALAAPVLADVAEAVAAAGIPVDDVVLGNCMGPGGDVARVAALRAGLGHDVPGVTVDRQCGSGLDAVIQSASRVRAGDARLVLAGGAESASTAPHRSWPGSGERYTRAPFAPAGFADPDMGPAADRLAAVLGISRARQDAWAARSHARAAAAQSAGVFDGEIVPIDGVVRDDRPRPSMDVGRLARFAPVFASDHATGSPHGSPSAAASARGTVTAGNSCGFSDGAAAMAVTTEAIARALGLPALRVRAVAVAAGDPALPGLGAAPAARAVLARAGLTAGDLGFVEITEAFAAQVLAVSDELGLDEDLISGDGGAIALGHPWGASGAVLLVRLAARMAAADDARLGLAACSIGGGQGVAMIVERVA